MASIGNSDIFSELADLQGEVTTNNAPGYFWFNNPTLEGTESTVGLVYNEIPWTLIKYGNPANLNASGIWTCPITGLWEFNFSIYIDNYSGYASYRLFHNGSVVTAFEQAANGGEWLTTSGTTTFPVSQGDTLYWTLSYTSSTSPPIVADVNGCHWQGYMVAPSYTAA